MEFLLIPTYYIHTSFDITQDVIQVCLRRYTCLQIELYSFIKLLYSCIHVPSTLIIPSTSRCYKLMFLKPVTSMQQQVSVDTSHQTAMHGKAQL